MAPRSTSSFEPRGPRCRRSWSRWTWHPANVSKGTSRKPRLFGNQNKKHGGYHGIPIKEYQRISQIIIYIATIHNSYTVAPPSYVCWFIHVRYILNPKEFAKWTLGRRLYHEGPTSVDLPECHRPEAQKARTVVAGFVVHLLVVDLQTLESSPGLVA